MTSPAAVDGQTLPTTAAPPRGPLGTPPADVSRVDWLAEYPPPRSLPLDQEALRIYEHAYAMGLQVEAKGTPPVTFSTVVAALLAGQDDTSRWFALLAAENGPDAEAVFSEKSIDRAAVQAIPAPGKPQPVRLSSTDKQLLTASARAVLGNAEGWAQRVGGSDIGVRHLVASYVLNPPPAHRKQMQKWKYQEAKWRPAFFAWASKRYTAEQWTDASQRPAPTAPVAAFEQQEIKGDALAFPGDASTFAVLERAAAYHARRTDTSLRLQTVFHALVATAQDNGVVRAAIQPVADAVGSVETDYRKGHDAFFSAPAPAGPAASFAALDISPRVLNALETARELAAATRTDTKSEFRVGVLHLAGALVSRRVGGDGDLEKLGLKAQELRRALIRHATKTESGEIWREALGEEEPIQAGYPLRLNSDEPEAVVRLDKTWASDPLVIRRDVETFAALLASQSLEPPLSIGLFGPWGSGKTTFLKRLHRAVESRAEEAKKAIAESQPSQYVSNVVHVGFNAWHFAEDALTSSLVDTILRALRDYMKDDKRIDGKELRQQKLEALETTKRKMEAAKEAEQAALARVAQAETAFVNARTKAAEAATSVQTGVQGVWSATKGALKESRVVRKSGVLDAVGDTIQSTEDLRNRLEALRNRPARVLGDLGWLNSLIFAALVLVVPPLVTWLIGRLNGIDQTLRLLSSATATLSVIGVWARAAAGAVAKVDKAVTEVADAYAKRLAEDQGVITAQAKLDAAHASAATAAAGLEAAREQLARARTDAVNATLPAQMLQLVSSRLDAQTYNRELTTLSLARADLEELSRKLREQLSDLGSDPKKGSADDAAPEVPVRAVDRVILYIDDLDRCKPPDVVRVLQLVHMLLAFELFVVVVAVDARWVEEALIQSYPWLADVHEAPADQRAGSDVARPRRNTARVGPQEYLEKIFQIAFWLEPMDASRAALYLESLVPTPPSDWDASIPPGLEREIAGIELDYMRFLAAYVGPSPRRVKRLVNAYRLIKAGMPRSQLRVFLTRLDDDGKPRPGPYQFVIGLLVIGTGAPSSSAQILKDLAECDPGETLQQVIDRLRGRNHADWTMAAQVIAALMRSQKTNSVSELRGWARKVRRFLLNGPADTPVGEVRPVTDSQQGPVQPQ